MSANISIVNGAAAGVAVAVAATQVFKALLDRSHRDRADEQATAEARDVNRELMNQMLQLSKEARDATIRAVEEADHPRRGQLHAH